MGTSRLTLGTVLVVASVLASYRWRGRARAETVESDQREGARQVPRPLSEQVVVIVGASSGIGRASAPEFARRGARVVAAARGVQALDTLVDEIGQAGGTAVAVPTDVSDPAAVRALADTAEQRFGRIDTWVNNAAVSVWGRVDAALCRRHSPGEAIGTVLSGVRRTVSGRGKQTATQS